MSRGTSNKVRAGRLRELALFNKSIHLAEAMGAVEPRFVEESRKTAEADSPANHPPAAAGITSSR